MTDTVNESDLVAESTEKTAVVEKESHCSLEHVSSDVLSRKKVKDRSKKTKSDTRKSHKSSRSSSSRKSKNPLHKDAVKDRRSSSENRSCLSQVQEKGEVQSDDHDSSASGGHKRLLTRSKIRRLQRRKAFSSNNSSTCQSDTRKTRSEPICITLDSDSDDDDEDDDNVSMITNRPNRSARIRGEIIRKLSRTSIKALKSRDSSTSSSECEKMKRKKKAKKSKSVKTSLSSQAAKRKKYLVNRLASQSRVKLKKHKRPLITSMYKASRPKRDIKSIQKRYEAQKKEKQGIRLSTRRASHKNRCISRMERRTLRSKSTDTVADNNLKIENDSLTNVKTDDETKLPPDSRRTSDSKRASDNKNVRKHVKRESVVVPSEKEGQEMSQNLSTVKPEVEFQSETKTESTCDANKDKNEENANLELTQSVICNTEAAPNVDIEPKNVESSKTKVTKPVEPESKSSVPVEADSKDTKPVEAETKGTRFAEAEKKATKHVEAETKATKPVAEGETKATRHVEAETKASKPAEAGAVAEKARNVCSKLPVKQKKKIKKKLKPGDQILRKRGRPRLSDMKPVKNIPVLNDVIQIPFLQSSFCFIVAPKLPKCRECRIVVNRCNRSMHHAYCRFMEYRKLCYNKSGLILNAGFSEPSEATPEHLSQWLPQLDDPPKDLNCTTSKALIEHIGDQFCDLVEQEKEALSLHIGKDKVITWKRIVKGVREMCDVCYTTLFNIHWVCPICGLAVCIDCYKGRKQGITVEFDDEQPKNRDQYNWLLCTTLKQPHDIERLVMAQIIPGNALWTMRELLHKVRNVYNIPSYCKCNPHTVAVSENGRSTGVIKLLMCKVTKMVPNECSSFLFNTCCRIQDGENFYEELDFQVTGPAVKWCEGNDQNGLKSAPFNYNFEEFSSYEDFSTLRGNLLSGMNGDDNYSDSENYSERETSFSIDDVLTCISKSQSSDNKENSGKSLLKHYSHRYPVANNGRDPLPIRIYTTLESNLSYSNIPHSWFCNGRLLFLLQSNHPDNLTLFQEQWKRGQPILVKGVDERLSKELWHPDAFCRDFGEVRNDLIDCRTGAIIRNQPMRRFWEGFESFDKRLKNDNGEFMLLKLKDWPPGEDFKEMLPKRFDNLMEGLPLPEYTHRDGILNLAGRLPSWFVRPDLGPKMYNAYGSALYPTKGTTNLHLDVSDAVNVMVYVGIPQDGNAQLHIEEALKAIDEGGCDSLMRARVRCRGAKPGALWHIYNAKDANKIRELLNKAAIERGEKLEAHHDPIHDQSWYLDAELRGRLYNEYGVEGYAIAQCLGDAVFIPAGAPHQVRNLHSCVKVAEDFVSPENIAHCFRLTQEFRHLSDTHTNHEDKLQIKNIIYHVVRDALAHLLRDSDSGES